MKTAIKPGSIMLCFGFGLLTIVVAQEAKPKPRPMPILTTEDVITKQPFGTPTREAGSEAKDKALLSASKARTSAVEKKQTAKAGQQEKAENETAENEWNEKLRAAQQKVAELKRNADSKELEISRLRNQQFSATAKDAGDSAAINARAERLASEVRNLREEAARAQAEVAVLRQEGEQKEYKIAQESATRPDGSPNAGYYESRLTILKTELSDADTAMQVIQLRINDLTLRLRKNVGGLDEKGRRTNSSDVFAIRRLKTALQEEEQKLSEAQQKRAEAARQIEELQRAAALAGVNPGNANQP